MIPEHIQTQIITIWDKFIVDHQKVVDIKGNDLENIDEKREEAIFTLKIIVEDFLIGKLNISEFKTDIDSFNKQNNLWGFTSIKGQMFFNLLLKTLNDDEQNEKLTKLLITCISEPTNLVDALNKIDLLDKYTSSIFNKAPDKRKTPNPGSVCYFLSYFWQIHDAAKWPIMYSSMVASFSEIGLWSEPASHRVAYQTFFNLNEEIKEILTAHTGKSISNWEAEHAFWNFKTVTAYPKPTSKSKGDTLIDIINDTPISVLKVASFDINAYLLPLVSNLIELGKETEGSAAAKGSKFEKVVCEVFKQLGFTVQQYGQGTGREPDLIAIHKVDNVAFIVDAKAYSNGYMMGAGDERAITEYISHYCPKLQKEGIKKIGFIIVSNAFKADFANFINDITWKSDIKRFILLTSEALLHLLAYKTKDQLPLSEIIDALISLGNSVSSEQVIQKFDDI